MSDVKRYKLAESVGYENEFGDCGLRIPAGQVVVRAADYDAETARADRAEARCAALFHALEMCVWRHAPYNEGLIDLQELRPYMNNLEAEALLKPHPGQRFLDLAQIVEGLPHGIELEKMEATWRLIVKGNVWATIYSQPLADALAKLLQWRQGGGK